MPPARDFGSDSFFDNPDWRYELNQSRGVVRDFQGFGFSKVWDPTIE